MIGAGIAVVHDGARRWTPIVVQVHDAENRRVVYSGTSFPDAADAAVDAVREWRPNDVRVRDPDYFERYWSADALDRLRRRLDEASGAVGGSSVSTS